MRLPLFFCVLPALWLAAGCQNLPIQLTERPGSSAAMRGPDAPLRETRWLLREIGSKAIVVPPSTAEPFVTLRSDGTAEGNAGCNRFRGQFVAETPGELKFGPLMSTRMSCPAIATETEFNRVLSQTVTYRINGDRLLLLNGANSPLARLEAVYLR